MRKRNSNMDIEEFKNDIKRSDEMLKSSVENAKNIVNRKLKIKQEESEDIKELLITHKVELERMKKDLTLYVETDEFKELYISTMLNRYTENELNYNIDI